MTEILFFSADDEFQDLCFEFGLELDEVVSQISHEFSTFFIIFANNLSDKKSSILFLVWGPAMNAFPYSDSHISVGTNFYNLVT